MWNYQMIMIDELKFNIQVSFNDLAIYYVSTFKPKSFVDEKLANYKN